MMRVVALGLTAALAGCSGAPQSGPVAFCQAQAESTPAVKDMTLKSVSNPYFMSQSSDLIAATKAQAVRDCLKRQGVLAAGDGVEGVPQTAGTLFQK
jgi:hypothetical protein